MRVLIVHDSLSENGGVRLTLDLAERLDRLRVATEVFALQPVRAGSEARVPESVALTRGVPAGGRFRFHAAGAGARLVRAARRADVVVSGSEVGLGLLATHASARVTRRPYVVLVHAPLEHVLGQWVGPRLRGAARRAHRHADAAVCVSGALVGEVVANGLDADRVHVVPNAVDVRHLRRLAGERRPGEPPVLLAAGRLSAEKGFDLLVRAHAELRARGVAHRLEIVGEGPDRDALLRTAAELGVADTVDLPGFVDDVPARLARASALVLTSRFEGSPLVLLEALALGVPVLSSRTAAPLGVLRPEQLVDASVDPLVQALESHLADPEPLAAAGRAAAAAMPPWAPDDAARAYLRIFEQVSRRLPAAARAEVQAE
jgi:glycosyltransferase involved in cell wall biosynthesis